MPEREYSRQEPVPPWPHYDADEIDAALAVLREGQVNYWTGTECRAFERDFAEAVGTRHAVAVSNGSVALECALLAAGVGEGDEVIVPCRTFVATASSVVRVGARPCFADVDSDSQNISASTIAAAATSSTKAIIVVHLAGRPCEMDPILEFARSHDLLVIEDCAQAHGATYRGRAVGSMGDVAAWSFCQDKIITTAGEGGMLTTSSELIWSAAWSIKDHGRNPALALDRSPQAGFRWSIDSFGTNWRMTEIQAAVGRLQLRKLPSWIAKRRQNAHILDERFSQPGSLRVNIPPKHIGHAYYKYYVHVRPERLKSGWDRDRILANLLEKGVPASVGICPEIYREKAFVDAGLSPAERLPVARELGATSLCLPVHPTMEAEDVHRMADLVEGVLVNASR